MELDDRYTKFILDKISFFQYINPNVITLLGLATDFVILYLIGCQLWILVALALWFRYTCDCLDGAVARKYKKVSNLGGFLDTLADNILIFIVIFSLTSLQIAVLVVIANLVYLHINRALIHHNNLRQKGNLFKNVYRFFTINNCLLYIIIFLLLKIFVNG